MRIENKPIKLNTSYSEIKDTGEKGGDRAGIEDDAGSWLAVEIGGMGEVAAILGASPSDAIQSDPSHAGSNRNEQLGVLFYSSFLSLP